MRRKAHGKALVEEEGEPEDRPEAGAVPILGVKGKVLSKCGHAQLIYTRTMVAAIDVLGKPNASTGRRIRHPEQYPQGIRQRTCGRCERPETGKMGNRQDAYQSKQAYRTGA